jgi:hypothetical protein
VTLSYSSDIERFFLKAGYFVNPRQNQLENDRVLYKGMSDSKEKLIINLYM